VEKNAADEEINPVGVADATDGGDAHNPLQALHMNNCPVNTPGFINIVAPRNYCNDTVFHNERCQNTEE
jgi:hypothetical protein